MSRLSASLCVIFISQMTFLMVSGRPGGDPLDPFLSGPEQALVGTYTLLISAHYKFGLISDTECLNRATYSNQV
jgi:hypothetical protein